MERVPDPPSTFIVDPICRMITAGERLWRIYFRAGPHPTRWNELRAFGPTANRFDHHTRPKRIQNRAILYATHGADAVLTALAEVFQDTRLIDRTRRKPWLVAFRLARPARLLDTGSDWPVRAGGNMAINSGSRARARAWSRAIHRDYTDVEGIWYPSSLTNQSCVALYERASAALPASPDFHEPLASPALTAGLSVLADRLEYRMR